MPMSEFDPENTEEIGVVTVPRERVKAPRMYKVVLLNDDYTSMDFVVAILEGVFRKSPAEAVRIMLQVHKSGKGICGTYSKQIAEIKVMEVHRRARQEGYPLKCVIEDN